MLPAVIEVRRKQLEHEQVDDTVSFPKKGTSDMIFLKLMLFSCLMSKKFAQ